MKRLGRRNRPFWRICATDRRAARDGRVVEELGHYDPYLDNEDKVKIRRDRVVHWLKEGAQPSKTVKELLGHLGLDARGNEITPKPWPKKKKGPPPKAAERVAAEKAAAQGAEAARTDAAESAEAPAPEADAAPDTESAEQAEGEVQAAETDAAPAEQAEADAGDEENASA
jgi:small subunit ribosomal protein S16